jgi:hypothetical protein
LRELGFNVIHEPIDFFKNTNLGDIVVSNPPFTMKKEVLETLLKLDKPFILLMPLATLSREYFRRLFIDKDFMLALPQKRIQFIKQGQTTSKCNFECAFFCYGLGRSGVCFLEDKTTHGLGQKAEEARVLGGDHIDIRAHDSCAPSALLFMRPPPLEGLLC